MVIENFFIHHHMPSQFLYAGEKRVELYKAEDMKSSGNSSEKGPRKYKTIESFSLTGTDIDADKFLEISRELLDVDTGLVLNSSQFIFNIFEFDKLPWQPGMRRELVEWRLKKVFPENINDYWHEYYRLGRKRVFSILFRKHLKERLEDLFKSNNVSLTYMSNSTVEIINRIAESKNSAPDFFIEVDGPLVIAVFLDKGVPYYVRKFRVDQVEEIAGEAVKTTNYVKNSYSKVPRTYALIADFSETDSHLIRDELAKHEILPWQGTDKSTAKEQLIFPG